MTCQGTSSSSRTSKAAGRDSVVAGGHRTATAAAGLKDTGSIATDLSPHAGQWRANGQAPKPKAAAEPRIMVCHHVWLPSASPHRYRARIYLWCKGGRSAKCLRVRRREVPRQSVKCGHAQRNFGLCATGPPLSAALRSNLFYSWSCKAATSRKKMSLACCHVLLLCK